MSNFYSLLTAVQTDIQRFIDVGVLTGLQASQVFVQKLPRQDTGVDLLPGIYICPGQTGEKTKRISVLKDVQTIYPIEVTFLAANNFDVTGGLGQVLQWREVVRLHYEQSFQETVVPNGVCYDIQCTTTPPSWLRELILKGYDVSVLTLTFWTVEKSN